MIESCLAVSFVCLVFFGLLQISQLVAARDVLHYAAARGARAKTVGFNHWMVRKAIHVAAIPNSGKMTEPEFENVNPRLRQYVEVLSPGPLWSRLLGTTPRSEQANIELARIPEFLATENAARGRFILNYRNWESGENAIRYTAIPLISFSDDGEAGPPIHVAVNQAVPLWVPFHRAFYANDTAELLGDSYMENHFPLYLDDMGW